jgi:acyl carrier protein phosphodiesterase
MNYLAHLYLSPSDDESRLGNLLGDFVKNKSEFIAYDKIYQGICFHQKIDRFTDSHLIVLKSKQRISEKNRRYAGVLMDIFYDHFLAKNWQLYSPITLDTFVENFYKVLEKYSLILPKRLFDIKPSMIQENWLLSYRDQAGIFKALERIANRLSVPYVTDEVMAELSDNYQEFQTAFNLFFDDIIEYAKSMASS